MPFEADKQPQAPSKSSFVPDSAPGAPKADKPSHFATYAKLLVPGVQLVSPLSMDDLRNVREDLPYIGGGIGALAGEGIGSVPLAGLGAGVGSMLKNLLTPSEPASLKQVGSDALTKGVLPEVGGQVIGMGLKGVQMGAKALSKAGTGAEAYNWAKGIRGSMDTYNAKLANYVNQAREMFNKKVISPLMLEQHGRAADQIVPIDLGRFKGTGYQPLEDKIHELEHIQEQASQRNSSTQMIHSPQAPGQIEFPITQAEQPGGPQYGTKSEVRGGIDHTMAPEGQLSFQMDPKQPAGPQTQTEMRLDSPVTTNPPTQSMSTTEVPTLSQPTALPEGTQLGMGNLGEQARPTEVTTPGAKSQFIPAKEAMELRRLSNEASRFTKQQVYHDPTATARNQVAYNAGNHARQVLGDLDPAIAKQSDELEHAYALRKNFLDTASPEAPFKATTGSKEGMQAEFDKAAGTKFGPYGEALDDVRVAQGKNRAAKFLKPKELQDIALTKGADMLKSTSANAAQKVAPYAESLGNFLGKYGDAAKQAPWGLGMLLGKDDK